MTSGGRWFFFLAIVISNVLFVFVWLRHLVNTFFQSLLLKHPKLYMCCCLCCSLQRFKAKMRSHHDRNQFKERIDSIQSLKAFLSKAEEFYNRGLPFEESEAFDKAIQASTLELSRLSYEEIEEDKLTISKKQRGPPKIFPELDEKSFTLDSTQIFGNLNHTIEYVQQKLMRIKPLRSPTNCGTFETTDNATEDRMIKVAKRHNKSYYEEKDEVADIELDCLSEGSNQAYIDIVSKEPENTPVGEFIPSKPLPIKGNLRNKKQPPLKKRKSIFIPVRDDFELDLRPAQLGTHNDYNLEFVQAPRKKSEQTSIRTKIKRTESLGQSQIYSPTRGAPSPLQGSESVRSLGQFSRQILEEKYSDYELSFNEN